MRSGSPKHLSRGRRRKWDTASVLLEESSAGRPLDFGVVFGNARPVEVEIGTGKGTFLLARAVARPELNFLGIELARAYCHYAADRIRRARLVNVRMLQAEAGQFFRVCLPKRSIWRVHIYFPDPWPKRRHHHRRLIQPVFVHNLKRTLKPGGQLLIVTDHLEYFQQVQSVLQELSSLTHISFPRAANYNDKLVGTNYGYKYAVQKRAFYSAAWFRYV